MTDLMPASPFVERTPDEERAHRKRRLAAAFRIFGRFGFDEGVAGHITARDPERLDHFWVNPFGMSFKQIKASDLILCDHDGNVVEGSWPVNRAAFAIHSRIHHARPDVVAAAHSHSKYGRAFSTLRRPLRPLTQDSCIFFEDHVLFDDYTGVVDDPAEGDRIAAALGGAKAAILANHGLLTVGHSVDEALFWYVTMERTCEVELSARAAGEPHEIDPEVAALTRSQVGTNLAGWFSAQPLFDWIEAVEPDLAG
ncbi:class II aldolase/adducin family protein [Iamia sp. SCSIO 61187]|uniref:class II aldolase/adducin family protein n=1 Tax=Iamia sp. SCSIO 61187 TaxID=2722752 RepID=UPI001C62A16A|nr:class II aldolase/adducin family protein [Iamia sp. SCSIO 61187]QYG92943.1 class II aldolase/adducin family protein [Iamia sp. SCSIO 61187]